MVLLTFRIERVTTCSASDDGVKELDAKARVAPKISIVLLFSAVFTVPLLVGKECCSRCFGDTVEHLEGAPPWPKIDFLRIAFRVDSSLDSFDSLLSRTVS